MADTVKQVEETGKRLRRIAEVLFDGNKSELARALNMHPGSFTKYLREKRRPGAKILNRILRLGVNINWFLTGEGQILRPGTSEDGSSSGPVSKLKNGSSQYHRVPVVQVRLSEEEELQYNEVDDPVWLNQHTIRIRYNIDPDRLREFRVSSNRMAPSIRTGDRVRAALVPSSLPMSDMVEGASYLMFGPEGVFSTRVRTGDSGGSILLAADNPEADRYEVRGDDWTQTYRPIARVLEIRRSM